MLPILVLLLILGGLVAVPVIRMLATDTSAGERPGGVARWTAGATSIVALIAALLALIAVLGSLASPFLSTGAGLQLATVAVLAIPALAEAVLLILAGLLARSLRGPSASTRSLLVAGLGAVAFPIGALATILAGFSAADFGSGGAPYAAIVAAANANAGAAFGAILVVAGGLITRLVLGVTSR